MSFEIFRQINTFLPLLAGGWLVYRTVIAWPADWAKPHHVWHYRALLVLTVTGVFLTSFAAIVAESHHTHATYISMLYTFQSIAVAFVCWRWPQKARAT